MSKIELYVIHDYIEEYINRHVVKPNTKVHIRKSIEHPDFMTQIKITTYSMSELDDVVNFLDSKYILCIYPIYEEEYDDYGRKYITYVFDVLNKHLDSLFGYLYILNGKE